MIIQCEQCKVKYRVDESRIPGESAKVKCSRCQHIFLVSKDSPSHREPPISLSIDEAPKEPTPDSFQCPNCGFEQPPSQDCIKCGIVFSKFKERVDDPSHPYLKRYGMERGFPHDQAEVTQMTYAGFWRRLAALFIDGIILSLLIQLPIYIFSRDPQLARNATSLSFLIYLIFMWGCMGTSLGKMAMRIKIVSTNGSDISYWTAFLRLIGYIISSIPFYLGYLWMLWDDKKQTWHDKIASTCVIRTQ